MSDPDVARRCTVTGLYLLAATGGSAYRVAKDRGRGPLRGHPNRHVGPLHPAFVSDPRGRFDTIGSTVYFSDMPRTAFAEVLRGFRRELLKLAPLAEIAGYDDAITYAEAITDDAVANSIDAPWAISCDWQMARSIYHVRMPLDGWWVQIDHPFTLNALAEQLPDLESLAGRTDLTLADVEGEDRALTTTIAEHIRGLTLDTGHEPLGINFRSKSAYGRCFAWWDRRADAGLAPGRDDPGLIHSDNVDTPAFREVADHYGLPILPGHPRY